MTGAALFLFKVTFVSRLFLAMFAGLGFLGLVSEKLFVFSIIAGTGGGGGLISGSS